MIYSCTMFLNEFHLLDLKMSEEMEHIDKLIVVESKKTHSNKVKPTYLKGSIYDKKDVKIITIGDNFNSNAIHNEAYQRNVAIDGLNIKDDDVIICCDIDEILNGKDIPRIAEMAREYGHVKFNMTMYYYKINLKLGMWQQPFAVSGSYLKESKKPLTKLRGKAKKSMTTHGKHFSYLMTPENISYKLKSFLHTEYDNPIFTNMRNIKNSIKYRTDLFGRKKKIQKVKIDDTYPATILNNLGKWKEFIA